MIDELRVKLVITKTEKKVVVVLIIIFAVLYVLSHAIEPYITKKLASISPEDETIQFSSQCLPNQVISTTEIDGEYKCALASQITTISDQIGEADISLISSYIEHVQIGDIIHKQVLISSKCYNSVAYSLKGIDLPKPNCDDLLAQKDRFEQIDECAVFPITPQTWDSLLENFRDKNKDCSFLFDIKGKNLYPLNKKTHTFNGQNYYWKSEWWDYSRIREDYENSEDLFFGHFDKVSSLSIKSGHVLLISVPKLNGNRNFEGEMGKMLIIYDDQNKKVFMQRRSINFY